MKPQCRCSICYSSHRDEVAAAIQGGESLRSLSRRLNFSRSAVQRHARFCLKLKRDIGSEERLKRKIRDEALAGDLDAAYRDALDLRRRAMERGDEVAELKAERHVARLLALRQRQQGRLSSPVTVDAASRIDARKARIVFDPSEVPADLRHVGACGVTGPRELPTLGSLPDHAPTLRIMLKINFQSEPEPDDDDKRVQEALELMDEFNPKEPTN